MKKCISCNKNKGIYKHYNGGYVCDECIGLYFTCPDCGLVYDIDDFKNGDQGTGYCAKCKSEH